jgi:aldehyde oxidoreductase
MSTVAGDTIDFTEKRGFYRRRNRMHLSKKMVYVNGVERMFIYSPEKDTLAEVLRRYGMTGVKVGCNVGQCGACSIIVNGTVIRSCTKKFNEIEEHSIVETIEGLGTANNLHPLQQAWITYGGVQCGFCTPGFIMSAKALLDRNLNPNREDVRDWFQKHRNICRCTGYRPLVDSVMAAAEVLSGKKTMVEIMPKIDEKHIYNTEHPRPAALGKVLGVTDYGDDIKYKMPPGTLHVAIVQPRVASHAKIVNIDIAQAEKMEGVVKIVTAKDIKGSNRFFAPMWHPRATMKGDSRPVFSDEKIYRYGDVVAAVVADTQEHARTAAKAVNVEIDLLPEYLNYLDAAAPDAIRIHEESPNIYLYQPVLKGADVRDIMDESHCVVEGGFYSSREPHLSIEGDIVQAYRDENDNFVIHCKSQAVYFVKGELADAIGVPADKIRVIENPTGGSFGWATSAASFAIVVACLIVVNKPLTMTMTYEEHQHFSGKRVPTYSNGRLSCDKDGKLTAFEFEFGVDHGAYDDTTSAIVSSFVRLPGFPYVIPNVRGLVRIANTNHNFGTSYRGFGSPQSYTCSEALIDMLAEKMGIDPLEFRYINAPNPGDLTINSRPYRECSTKELIDMLRPYYEEAKASIAGKETEDKIYGVGVSCGGFNVTSGPMSHAEIDLELNSDGTVTHFNTWEDQGQGGDIGTLVETHEALKPLGLHPNQIRLMMNDTYLCPNSGIAAASRSHFVTGYAVIDAANKLMNAMRKPDATYRTYDEMIAEGIPTKYRGVCGLVDELEDIDPNTGQGDPIPSMTYGAFLAVAEVDKHTGKTKVLKEVVIADVGIRGNILAVDGQAYGGISHTIGFALSENYDDLKKHGSLAGAGVPTIQDIPDDITLVYREKPRKIGPFGSTGCSELFQSGGHMCILNAINDAIGARIYTLPASPDKVKAAIAAKAQGIDVISEKWFLGNDMYDVLEEIEQNPMGIPKSQGNNK